MSKFEKETLLIKLRNLGLGMDISKGLPDPMDTPINLPRRPMAKKVVSNITETFLLV